jgi:hypothetical protein
VVRDTACLHYRRKQGGRHTTASSTSAGKVPSHGRSLLCVWFRFVGTGSSHMYPEKPRGPPRGLATRGGKLDELINAARIIEWVWVTKKNIQSTIWISPPRALAIFPRNDENHIGSRSYALHPGRARSVLRPLHLGIRRGVPRQWRIVGQGERHVPLGVFFPGARGHSPPDPERRPWTDLARGPPRARASM